MTSHDYLTNDDSEKTGYGLYSYLLFSKQPDKYSQEKYLAIIESFLEKAPQSENLEKYMSRDSLNILYIPIRKHQIISRRILASNKSKAKWILKTYDYARAKVYLNKFIEEELNDGPYIISHTTPLSQVSSLKSRYLIQNFSYVHHSVVGLWMEEFLQQAKISSYWDKKYLNNLSNDLRNSIAIGAEGLDEVIETLTWWKESLNRWITVK